jgi:hypothetical protein
LWNGGLTMSRLSTKRNKRIIHALRRGKSTAEVGASFGLTPLRVRQIAAAYGARELRREELIKRFGERPTFDTLPNSAPIDVLMLSGTRMHGWHKRLALLRQCGITTLGRLRTTPNAELLNQPKVGERMLAKLRSICPYIGGEDDRPRAR